MNGVAGEDDWFHSFLDIGMVLETKSESKTDSWTDRRDIQIPPVFYRTSSPPVPSGAAAQKRALVIPIDSGLVHRSLTAPGPG